MKEKNKLGKRIEIPSKKITGYSNQKQLKKSNWKKKSKNKINSLDTDIVEFIDETSFKNKTSQKVKHKSYAILDTETKPSIKLENEIGEINKNEFEKSKIKNIIKDESKPNDTNSISTNNNFENKSISSLSPFPRPKKRLSESNFPLKEKLFVLTGLFSITEDRNRLVEFFDYWGMVKRTSISKKTDLLIYGVKLEDGRDVKDSNKFKKALTFGTLKMNEQDLDQIFLNFTEFDLKTNFNKFIQNPNLYPQNLYIKDNSSKEYFDLEDDKTTIQADDSITKNNTKQESYSKPLKKYISCFNMLNKFEGQLWSDIFAPKTKYNLVGNGYQISKLEQWLSNWERILENEKMNSSKKSKKRKSDIEFLNYKAVLLSGLPGIGKTSAARIIPKQLGFHSIEQNASDIRNKSSVESVLTSLNDNSVFGNNWEMFTSVKKNDIKNKKLLQSSKCVIVMDEVDGMTSDRGGIQTLIQFIKKSKQPIICICNDRDHPKIRNLAKACLDLKFDEPKIDDIKKLLSRVKNTVNLYRKENAPEFRIPSDILIKDIIMQTKGDIRQILNYIQLWYGKLANKKVNTMTTKDLDNYMNISMAAKILLNANKYLKGNCNRNDNSEYIRMNSKSNSSLFKKLMNLTFTDYELIPFYFYESHYKTINSHSFNKKDMFLNSKYGKHFNCDALGYKEEVNDQINFKRNFHQRIGFLRFNRFGIRPYSTRKPGRNCYPPSNDLNLMKLGLESQMMGDQFGKIISAQRNYKYLPNKNFNSCVYPGMLLRRNIVYPQFPMYLGKIGTMNKIKRVSIESRNFFMMNPPSKTN